MQNTIGDMIEAFKKIGEIKEIFSKFEICKFFVAMEQICVKGNGDVTWMEVISIKKDYDNIRFNDGFSMKGYVPPKYIRLFIQQRIDGGCNDVKEFDKRCEMIANCIESNCDLKKDSFELAGMEDDGEYFKKLILFSF